MSSTDYLCFNFVKFCGLVTHSLLRDCTLYLTPDIDRIEVNHISETVNKTYRNQFTKKNKRNTFNERKSLKIFVYTYIYVSIAAIPNVYLWRFENTIRYHTPCTRSKSTRVRSDSKKVKSFERPEQTSKLCLLTDKNQIGADVVRQTLCTNQKPSLRCFKILEQPKGGSK